MREEHIKMVVTNQLMQKFPDLKRLTPKKKKVFAKDILEYAKKDTPSLSLKTLK